MMSFSNKSKVNQVAPGLIHLPEISIVEALAILAVPFSAKRVEAATSIYGRGNFSKEERRAADEFLLDWPAHRYALGAVQYIHRTTKPFSDVSLTHSIRRGIFDLYLEIPDPDTLWNGYHFYVWSQARGAHCVTYAPRFVAPDIECISDVRLLFFTFASENYFGIFEDGIKAAVKARHQFSNLELDWALWARKSRCDDLYDFQDLTEHILVTANSVGQE